MVSSFCKFFLLLFCLSILTFQVTAQQNSFNTTLLSHVSFGAERGSGNWGYEDPDTKLKYALIGTFSSTRVYSLEDPTNPILRHTAPGAQGWWREMRAFNKHVYVATDQGADGMVIIDMTKAPDTITHIFYKPVLTVGATTKELERCHNIFIDENGFCYLSGCNISNRGVLIFDLKPDPKNPVYIGAIDQNYSHDVMVRGDTVYDSQISTGRLAIFDVSDKTNPVLMATKTTSRAFTHNAWPSDDTRYVFTTDERSNAYVDAYDISDLSDIKLLDQYRVLKTEGDGVVPHNAYYRNGYLIVSWYTDGIRILDVHRPDNMVEVGYYDTWEDPSTCHSGFNGCWGVFPFTDNDLIYGSDINNGLFIIRADYKRAAYLEGTVLDENGNPVEGVKVTIKSPQLNRKFSNPAGEFKTGHGYYGKYVVEASHPNYALVTDTVDFIAGEVTTWNVTLERARYVNLEIKIIQKDGLPVPAKIRLTRDDQTINLETDSEGIAEASILTNKYNILVTAWGYGSLAAEGVVIDKNTELTYAMDSAYVDSFESDLGWEIISSSENMRGKWEIDVPRGTLDVEGNFANPNQDDPLDYGNYAFVTENGPPGAPCADVDNGTTTLISPNIDLSNYKKPLLNFSYWFYTSGGNSPFNDTLKIFITNGETEHLLLAQGTSSSVWNKVENIKLKDILPLTDEMRFIVEVSDQQQSGHIVEAGFDAFSIREDISSTWEDEITKRLEIIPNPAHDMIIILLPDNEVTSVNCFNVLGQEVNIQPRGETNMYDISTLPDGLYFIKSGNSIGKFIKKSN